MLLFFVSGVDDPLKHLREVDSLVPNSRAWRGKVGPFLVELDFQQTPSGLGCWGAQCYSTSGTQLSSVSGDTLDDVFRNLRMEVRDSLNRAIERLSKQQEAFDVELNVARPSFFERLTDDRFGVDSGGCDPHPFGSSPSPKCAPDTARPQSPAGDGNRLVSRASG